MSPNRMEIDVDFLETVGYYLVKLKKQMPSYQITQFPGLFPIVIIGDMKISVCKRIFHTVLFLYLDIIN